MVIWVRCITLKLTLSHGKLNANFGTFNFILWRWPWRLEIYRLATFLNNYLQRFPNHMWCVARFGTICFPIHFSWNSNSLAWNLPRRKMDGGFYWALGDLKFPPTSEGRGLSQMGGLKFFRLFLEGTTGFSLLGKWGEVPPPMVKI